MALRYKNQNTPQHPIDLEELTGRRPMERHPVRGVFVAQDSLPSHTRRVLLQVGLHGANAWQVRDDATDAGSQTRPTRLLRRYVARSPRLRLTPGCFLRMHATANRTGLTVKEVEGDWIDDGPFGEIGVNVTYRNTGGGSSVASAVVVPVLSLAPNGAQPSGDGGAWGGVQQLRTALLKPPVVVSPAAMEAWSDGVTAEISVYYQGSPRPVDVVVYEEAFQYARDTDDGLWALPLLTDGAGKSLAGLAHDYPVYQAKVGQTGGGTYVLADAALRQRELGPMLWSHTAHVEPEAAYDAVEVAAQAVTDTTPEELLTGIAAYATDRGGVSVSCGANARVQAFSHHTHVLRDKDNCVPVRCWILAKMAAGGTTGVVRFTSADYSIAEVRVTGTDWAWFSTTGHLRCGLGPEDTSLLQVFARVTAGTLSWRHLAIEYAHLA